MFDVDQTSSRQQNLPQSTYQKTYCGRNKELYLNSLDSLDRIINTNIVNITSYLLLMNYLYRFGPAIYI